MSKQQKQVVILLIALAIAGLAVVAVVYDRLPQAVQDLNPLQKQGQSGQDELQFQTNEQALKNIEEEFALIEKDYDFAGALSADDIAIPDLENDLEVEIE